MSILVYEIFIAKLKCNCAFPQDNFLKCNITTKEHRVEQHHITSFFKQPVHLQGENKPCKTAGATGEITAS